MIPTFIRFSFIVMYGLSHHVLWKAKQNYVSRYGRENFYWNLVNNIPKNPFHCFLPLTMAEWDGSSISNPIFFMIFYQLSKILGNRIQVTICRKFLEFCDTQLFFYKKDQLASTTTQLHCHKISSILSILIQIELESGPTACSKENSSTLREGIFKESTL